MVGATHRQPLRYQTIVKVEAVNLNWALRVAFQDGRNILKQTRQNLSSGIGFDRPIGLFLRYLPSGVKCRNIGTCGPPAEISARKLYAHQAPNLAYD